jgi:hypothetical protein
MPFIQSLTKLFTSAWSIVREMVLNDEPFMQVLRVNRRRAVFSIVVMASLVFSAISFGVDARFVSILLSYVRLQRSYQDLETKYQKEHAELEKRHGQDHARDLPAGNATGRALAVPSGSGTGSDGADPRAQLRAALTDWTPEN